MKKQILLLFLLLLEITSLHATHNRAGEITYEYISGYTYKIIVTTYTYSQSSAYRCSHDIDFGDGKTESVQRINGPLGSYCGNIGTFDTKIPAGENLGNNVQKNVYQTIHTYPGSGNYIISLNDPDRNHGVCNIDDFTPFYIRTELIINPFLGPNSSPKLLNPPIDDACVGECFEHNPGAYDADGDSLAYSLVASYADGLPIANYRLPPNLNLTNIDAVKGDVVWCVPPFECEYNIAILIKEYRRLPGSSERHYIGSILRDMQIDVHSGCNNDPPQIKPINDTCVVAGANINIGVKATDINNNLITLTAAGGVFQKTPKATFITSSPLPGLTTGVFNWNPICDNIQLLPYLVTFKAIDSHPTNPLADFESMQIRVVAPAPTTLTATASGASIILNWNHTTCNSTAGANPLINYLVYRKKVCSPWKHDVCETGVPSYTGYSLIGKTSATVTTFTDNENGAGLTNGIDYSYIVAAEYLDGAQSYATENVCEKLKRDVPIITNVSVKSTGAAGSIWIHWIPPIADSENLDTLASPPTYEIRVMQAGGFSVATNAFSAIASYTYTAFWQMKDTGFVSTNINTQTMPFTYRLDFYANGVLVGSSNTASSVHLTSSPTDNQVDLSWKAAVSWTNYKYFIYRETFAGSDIFDLIDSTTSPAFSDVGLVNGRAYCYKIKTEGAFSDTAIIAPLYNYSQVKCEIPVDIIPPCQPDIVGIDNDCDAVLNTISWRNPDNYCSDDVMTYKVYFSPTNAGDLALVKTITNEFDTVFTHSYLYENSIPSVAGCYAVAAVDSTGNESPILTKQCVDNCPIYELPNVFTPNGDKQNDLFTPLATYRYIKDIDIKIYNRWGTLMFETTNRDILWDGSNMANNKPCTDGVYFYICTVNEIRLAGITSKGKKGFIQLFNNTAAETKAK
jgi:gliding motility-associated-like protein